MKTLLPIAICLLLLGLYLQHGMSTCPVPQAAPVNQACPGGVCAVPPPAADPCAPPAPQAAPCAPLDPKVQKWKALLLDPWVILMGAFTLCVGIWSMTKPRT